MLSVGRAGPADYGEPEGGNTMKILNDLGVRAILALILVCAIVIMVGAKIAVPKELWILATAAVTFYFSNRSTLDKP